MSQAAVFETNKDIFQVMKFNLFLQGLNIEPNLFEITKVKVTKVGGGISTFGGEISTFGGGIIHF